MNSLTPTSTDKLDAYKVEAIQGAFQDIAEKHNALVGLISGIIGQAGVQVTVSAGNIIIGFANGNPDSEGAQSGSTPFPFQVTSTDGANAQIYYGTLTDVDKSTDIPITDLTTPFELGSDTCAWINVTVASLVADSPAAFVTGASFPSAQIFSGDDLTEINVPIGKVIAASDSTPFMPGFEFGSYHFLQMTNSNLLLKNECAGNAAIYAYPWSGSMA